MLTSFTCPTCRTVLKTKVQVPAGKRVKCPKCATIFAALDRAPAESHPPDDHTGVRASKPPAVATARHQVPPIDDDQEGRETRRRRSNSRKRRKKQGSMPLLLCVGGAAGGLIAVLLILGLVWPGFLLSGEKSRREHPAAAKEVAADKQRANPPDQSLTTAQYIERGLPAPDRPWFGTDMKRAAQVLVAIAAKDPAELPRYKSPRSGEVFARLVAAEQNLKLARDKSLPVNARLTDAAQVLLGANEIFKRYLDAMLKGNAPAADLIELLGAQLVATATLGDLIDEFTRTLNKADPSYNARMAGFRQSRQGMATEVSGCLTMLTEEKTYRTEERLRLLEYLEKTLPDIMRQLTPAARQEVQTRLNQMVADRSLEPLQAALRDLQKKVSSIPEQQHNP